MSGKGLGLYLLRGREVVATDDLVQWATSLEGADRQVAIFERDGACVSTVFLGIDHNWTRRGPPVLFETMVFGGPSNGKAWRYRTYAEALTGHVEVVETLFNLKLTSH